MLQGWTMREAQANRIKEVVGSHIDVTNHVHFARLFQSQLIMVCFLIEYIHWELIHFAEFHFCQEYQGGYPDDDLKRFKKNKKKKNKFGQFGC